MRRIGPTFGAELIAAGLGDGVSWTEDEVLTWGPNQEAVEALLEAHDPATQPPRPAITYKADIWRRATDEEAEIIEAGMAQQPARSRNLFRDAQYLDHADVEFEELLTAFQFAFGVERAAELLGPSEVP